MTNNVEAFFQLTTESNNLNWLRMRTLSSLIDVLIDVPASKTKIEFSSIDKELKQNIINNSVAVNIVASLPFIRDPQQTLAPNNDKTLKVYKTQVKN